MQRISLAKTSLRRNIAELEDGNYNRAALREAVATLREAFSEKEMELAARFMALRENEAQFFIDDLPLTERPKPIKGCHVSRPALVTLALAGCGLACAAFAMGWFLAAR